MYFDFEDYHPDISPVGRAISWREGVLLSIIVHLVMVILILVAPQMVSVVDRAAARAGRGAAERSRSRRCSSCSCSRASTCRRRSRRARAAVRSWIALRASPERAPEAREPAAVLARQHARARRTSRRKQVARGQGPQPDPAAGKPATSAPPDRLAEDSRTRSRRCSCRRRSRARRRTARTAAPRRRADRSATRCATCSATCSARRSTTQGGGGGQFGPEIQFDTKGVEFGPWIRRFIAQVKRNWFIPVRGDVDEGARRRSVQRAQGRLDHRSARSSGRARSTRSTTPRSARCPASNPTRRCRRSIPTSKAFFTVTFFYNETPPR